MKITVRRFHERMESPRYESFVIDPEPGMTVLSALFQIQERFDESLAFRYSCRGAVCGTCGMLINHVPRLACRTQLRSLVAGDSFPTLVPQHASEEPATERTGEDVLVEPLPHLPVIRDLIVDMSSFFHHYRVMEPSLRPVGDIPGKEHLMDPVAVKELEEYTTCILCAACCAACPVDGRNPAYPGPAALASLYRFHIDPREREGISRLRTADTPDGWWACEFHGNCRKVCPRGVSPIRAIGRARQELRRREVGRDDH